MRLLSRAGSSLDRLLAAPSALNASKTMRWLRLLMRMAILAAASLTVLFLLLVVVVRFVVVPHIGDYRDEITRLIAHNIGRQVSIGKLDAGWDGWSPTLDLVDFTLFDASGR